MSNARNLANLLGGSTTISIESLSADIPITEKFTTTAQLPVTATIGEQAFVEETNRLYIWNGSGWYNIALINTNPNITSDHDSSYTLSYGAPLNISVDAVDPEGLNLNYSYYTSDSIGNVATITNDSSEFTITPSSDYSVEGTFGLVFRASDGVNLATSGTSNFTLANQAPSLSGNSASYVLSDDGSTPIIINLTSVDPEGQPITYTATGDSGFNAIATVSNDSSVFTITPKSADSAVSGTGTLTFTASDGIKSINAASSFSLSFVSVITDSKYTTLLATADGTSDNNNITDSSTNNHTITVNGDAYAGSFSPYRSGGYSMYFNSSYLKFAEGSTSDFNMGTNAFTIEAWVRPTTASGSEGLIYHNRFSGSGNGKGKLYIQAANLRADYRGDDGLNYELRIDNVFTANTWSHICLLRDTSDNKLKLYHNGTLGQSLSVPSTVGILSSNSNTGVGGTGGQDFPGDIANLRVVNGTAITPTSSSILEKPTNVTNTVLLMIGGNFVDYSGNAPQINTYYGPPEIKAYGPLDYTEYSATDHGGSVYYDGSGDSLTFSEVDFGTGDFCIEGWFNRSDSSDGTAVSGFGNPTDNLGFIRFGKDSANTISMSFQGSWVFRGVSVGEEINAGNWFHYVITRSGTAIKAFVNGKLITTASSSEDVNITAVGFNHANGGNFFNGYVSDLRVNTSIPTEYQTSSTTHGSSIFTSPTAPLSSSGSELHIKGTDASIIDKSQGGNLKLFGNTTGSTTQAKFSNTKSMYFDGSGDRATATGIPDLGDDFTIECWVYSTATGNRGIVSSIDNVGNWGSNGYWSFGCYASNTLQLQIDGGSYSGSSTSLSTNQWVHIAVTRTSNTIRYFINGVRDSTTFSNSLTLKNPSGIVIGSSPNNSYIYNYTGYIQDLRIANECKYTAADETSNIPSAPLEG